MVLLQALQRAGSQVCEPMAGVTLEMPTDTVSRVLSLLAQHGARVDVPPARAELSTIEAVLPAALVRDLQRALPALTRGEGVLESRLAGHEPVTASAPTRRRTTPDPLNREEYLMHVARRI